MKGLYVVVMVSIIDFAVVFWGVALCLTHTHLVCFVQAWGDCGE